MFTKKILALIVLILVGTAIVDAVPRNEHGYRIDAIGQETVDLGRPSPTPETVPVFGPNPQGILIFSGGPSRMEERRLPKPQTIVTSTASSLDGELANSIPSYVGLSTDEKGGIRKWTLRLQTLD